MGVSVLSMKYIICAVQYSTHKTPTLTHKATDVVFPYFPSSQMTQNDREMYDSSVSWWLQQIRNFTESYEPTIEIDNSSNIYENVSFSRRNNRKRDCRLFLDDKQNTAESDCLLFLQGERDPHYDNMTEVDGCVYENIWDLRTGERRFELKHADICRVSFDFNESAEEFEVIGDAVPGLSRDFSEHVMLWKNEILFDYSSEEEAMEFPQVKFDNVRILF